MLGLKLIHVSKKGHLYSLGRRRLAVIRIPNLNLKPSDDHLRSIMKIPIPLSWCHSHLSPTAPTPDLQCLQRVLRHEKLGNSVTWQRGKIEMFFSSTGACTATKSPIANQHSHINAQLYSASIKQIFRMRLFVKVESASSKLLKTASKYALNGCKERPGPLKMLMKIFQDDKI